MTNATKENDVDAGGSEGTAKAAEGVQAVVFALHILEFMARQSEAIGVTELATAFGTTKSRIFRHLRTLLLQGYIVQDDAGRYKVGTRLVALGNAVMRNFDLVQVSSATMRALRDRVGSSVVLCHSEDEGVRVLSVVQGLGQSQIEITVRPGSLMGFHASAQGKVSLAFGQPELLARQLSKPLVAHSPQTIVDPAQLKEELARVRRQGWASAPNQAVTGLNAVAAPLFDAAGILIGTLAVVDSVQFLPEPPPEELLQQLTDAARAISASLGYMAR
ncbi:IclR family transcriptional regulator [Massilia norwichensis]|jgi:DNA-binding IclR family transcriptional regulator|uniref:IclR family transcriptional regulator n=1 Tax=Massilia norwichensis TaxID=1442366 RepID=A0ABT2A7L4_9BURK|nr:IclR family transcriptional regulator [Massilia norwichensis]MCS0590139.1 IclR family transcriptional regulator [Massilia norwichensis]